MKKKVVLILLFIILIVTAVSLIIVKNKKDISNEDENKRIKSGIITNIENNIITIQSEENDATNKIKIDENNVTNYRTNEKMIISDLKVGDYYDEGDVIRNIVGDEWKEECIKNLAYCYNEGTLVCNPQKIENIENKGDYALITFIMNDSTTAHFDESVRKFELKAIAHSDLNIPTSSGSVSVYNLKEEVEGFMFWIGLDKNTINDEYPTISDIEIYDK